MMEQRNIAPQQSMDIQEKIKRMSPEELKQFQKQQCIFCHIAGGKIPSRKVYEDEKVVAVLDINPANPGHLLLLPKEHFVIMPNMPEEDIAHIFMVAKALSNSILKTLKANGTNIFVANGVAAGQKAQHFIVHIIPRNNGDNLNLTIKKNEINMTELEKVKKMILPAVNKIFGIEQKLSIEQKNAEAIRKNIVDAEFKESHGKREAKKGPKEELKKEPKEEEDEISLDDIAELLP